MADIPAESRAAAVAVTTIEPEDAGSRVTFQEVGRNFLVLRILPSELKALGSFQNSINFGFFTLMAGLAVGFGSNLVLSHETMSDRKLWLFGLLTFASTIMALYFGLRARGDREESKNRIDDIMNQKKSNDS